ncbi:MAG: hypothetical protein AVDCRST_MAG35-2224, partial [uncultured Quadrisphaera sp.]
WRRVGPPGRCARAGSSAGSTVPAAPRRPAWRRKPCPCSPSSPWRWWCSRPPPPARSPPSGASR